LGWLERCLWFQTLVTWWRTRHLGDREFRQHLLKEVIEMRNQLHEEYKDEPADKQLIETFNELDSWIEEASAQC